ncbi:hypothetical protein [Actinophytocola sp.]
MRRLVWVVLPVLLVVAGCRDSATSPGVDQQFSNVESTLDAIESDVAGD